MKNSLFALALTFLWVSALAQTASKPALDHSVYDSWKSFGMVQVPHDGNVLVYEVNPQVGTGSLIFKDLTTGKEITLSDLKFYAMTSDCKRAIVSNFDKECSLLDLTSGEVRPLKDIVGVKVSEYGTTFSQDILYFSDSGKLCSYDFQTSELKVIASFGEGITIDRPVVDGNHVGFVVRKIKGYGGTFYLYDGVQCRKIISDDDPRVLEGMTIVSPSYLFRSDGDKLFLGLQKRPKKVSPITEEAPRVRVWAWDDDYLVPEEELREKRWAKKTYACRIDPDGGGDLIILESENAPIVEAPPQCRGKYVLISDDRPYRIRQQWELEITADHYLLNIETGEKELIFKEAIIKYDGTSPDGRFVCYLDCPSGVWHLYDLIDRKDIALTQGSEGIFTNDENDTPCWPFGFDFAKWSIDSKKVYLQDKYDIWAYEIASGSLRRLTDGYKSKTTYRWKMDLRSPAGKSPDYARYIDPAEDLYLTVFDHSTKQHGLARLRPGGRTEIIMKGEYAIAASAMTVSKTGRSKSPKLSYIVQKGNFETGYDLYMLKDGVETKLTDINPQRLNYNWGTAELVHWTVPSGAVADGILFKPEDFDPSKKYPLLVYYYELNSQHLYLPRDPMPAFAKINVPYFVSNGYIVFIPDVRYEIGHPGKGAEDYILSGCDMLCENQWIDAEHIGIQGQSWGGYQTAWLVTRTNRFAAACAGAPVCNMTSAYSGIRTYSGKVRQYLYEQSQSRIGQNLWEGLDLYMENSPLFRVPEITTPVLIMHADTDEVVPFSQGLEFFAALKRLGKRAWMLEYQGETHDLSRRANALDLSRRFAEFFGHFLKGEPLPSWMGGELANP